MAATSRLQHKVTTERKEVKEEMIKEIFCRIQSLLMVLLSAIDILMISDHLSKSNLQKVRSIKQALWKPPIFSVVIIVCPSFS